MTEDPRPVVMHWACLTHTHTHTHTHAHTHTHTHVQTQTHTHTHTRTQVCKLMEEDPRPVVVHWACQRIVAASSPEVTDKTLHEEISLRLQDMGTVRERGQKNFPNKIIFPPRGNIFAPPGHGRGERVGGEIFVRRENYFVWENISSSLSPLP